ncbi:MAG: Na(+)-translocating NADH-quinone reductase subunit C [Planctomycetaceae bacterium]|nr:Na(+)-translocating NADH-quinone reductase subunit C [Planctomycetaceae bacterium]
MQRDSVQNVIVVAGLVCLVCSVVVSGVAVKLRPTQEKNQRIEFQRNILAAAGLWDTKANKPTSGSGTVEEVFQAGVEKHLINLDTGEYVADGDVDFSIDSYEPKQAAKDPALSEVLSKSEDIASIKRREKYAFVYQVKGDDGFVSQYVFPIRGYGLWSTLRGFLSLDKDLQTVNGITYYEHAETPGLGGEVDNDLWKAKWNGKTALNAEGAVVLNVIKGSVDPTSDTAQYQVDGLSGATITTKGVDNMIKYWLGENGFGPYIEKVKSAGGN